jgi:hypothetical protein
VRTELCAFNNKYQLRTTPSPCPSRCCGRGEIKMIPFPRVALRIVGDACFTLGCGYIVAPPLGGRAGSTDLRGRIVSSPVGESMKYEMGPRFAGFSGFGEDGKSKKWRRKSAFSGTN